MIQRVLFRQAAKEESRRSEHTPVSITSASLAVDEGSVQEIWGSRHMLESSMPEHTASRVFLLSQTFCVPLWYFQRTSLRILRNPLVKQSQKEVWKRNCQVTSSKPSV